MYINIAVLKETQPHEKHVALVPSVAAKMIKLGAKLHMQSEASDVIRISESAYNGVVFMEDRSALVADADVVLAVQPPALAVIAKRQHGKISGTERETSAADAGIAMRYASSVIIVPGYGLAAAQGQQKLYEFVKLLIAAKVSVKFAIHPVAGRMPGQMDVLLAEAGVPYDLIFQLDDINTEFAATDVVLVIGANDVVHPAARTDQSSPIYGMPILNADKAKQVYVIKRGQGKGYSGIVNELFYVPNCNTVFGDAQAVLIQMIEVVRGLSAAAA